MLSTLKVFTGMIKTLRIQKKNMKEAVDHGYLLATDLADYLAEKGAPFRTAHSIVGKLVNYAIEKGKSFSELSLAEYKEFSLLFGEDVYAITIETAIAARNNIGGTAPKQVKQALSNAKKIAGEGSKKT